MLALIISADGTLSPDLALQKSRPVVFVQAGIHAGEISGKDGGFLAVRRLLENPQGKEELAKITFVFVPVFNIDGHEYFGPNNRPNQRGPEEVGSRTTAQAPQSR